MVEIESSSFGCSKILNTNYITLKECILDKKINFIILSADNFLLIVTIIYILSDLRET